MLGSGGHTMDSLGKSRNLQCLDMQRQSHKALISFTDSYNSITSQSLRGNVGVDQRPKSGEVRAIGHKLTMYAHVCGKLTTVAFCL